MYVTSSVVSHEGECESSVLVVFVDVDDFGSVTI